jgi:hypothetical protein
MTTIKSVFAFLQQAWRTEVLDSTKRVKGQASSLPLIDHNLLVRFSTFLKKFKHAP